MSLIRNVLVQTTAENEPVIVLNPLDDMCM